MSMTVKRTRSIWGLYLARLNVTNVEVKDSPWTATFTIPGLGMDGFDRYANPRMSSLMVMAVIARAYMHHIPYNDQGHIFLDWAKMTSDRFSFLSSTEYTLSRSMYNPEVTKWPLNVKVCLGYVGTASVALKTEIFSPDLPAEPIMTQISQTVSVDKTTRKACPLPDWYLKKYSGQGILESGLIIRPFERPSNTFVYPVQVEWSETDNYEHTNFSSYLRYAINALHAAVRHAEHKATIDSLCGSDDDEGSASQEDSKAKFPLTDITRTIIGNGLKTLRISYQNEALEGQKMDVHIWQQEAEPRVVYCSIERRDTKVCQLRLEYFDSQSSE